MAKVKLLSKELNKRQTPKSMASGEIQVFTVASSQAAWALARNPHSSSQERVDFSQRLIAESRALAVKKLSALKGE